MTYDTGAESLAGAEGRELALKLLAAQAIADAEFFARLRQDPRAAAQEIHIFLDDDDLAFLSTIDWNALATALPGIRAALHVGVAEASW
jgi:hypothetical protein